LVSAAGREEEPVTLIVATEMSNTPILIGDILLSVTGREIRPHVPVPTLHDVSLLPEEYFYSRSITGLRRKMALINSKFAVAWADRLIDAQTVLSELRTQFATGATSREELFHFLSNWQYWHGSQCILVGWLVDEKGPVSFKWDPASHSLTVDTHPYVVGSGMEQFLDNAQRLSFVQHGESVVTNVDQAIQEALGIAGNLLGYELLNSNSLTALFGGGFEVVYFSDGEFWQLDKITYLFWTFQVNADNSFRLQFEPLILHFSYKGDILVIIAMRSEQDPQGKVTQLTQWASYVVPPAYQSNIAFDREQLPSPVLSNSTYYCNFIIAPIHDKFDIASCLVFRNEPDNSFIRFQPVNIAGNDAEGLEISDEFIKLLSTLAAPVVAILSDRESKLYDQPNEEYLAELRSKAPFLANMLHTWANQLVIQARRTRGLEADLLFGEACEKYEAAHRLRPEMYSVIGNWGVALLDWGKTKEPDQAKQLFAAAREKFLEIRDSFPGISSFNLACVSALEGNEEECHYWLEQSRVSGSMPALDIILAEPDLSHVRERGWFRDLFRLTSQSQPSAPAGD
jgi:hypothetical protein